MSFCPFCGKQVSPCGRDLSGEWKKCKCICEDFPEWFMKGIHYPNMKSPTPMFKYEPRENQFYMHYRKGFGEGWIPITYCIYCGEPLSEMVEKYGIPKVIADRLDPSEWQGKYKLCTKKKVLTTNFQKRLLLFFLTQVENDIIVLCHRFMGHNHKDNSHNLSCMELIGISPPT